MTSVDPEELLWTLSSNDRDDPDLESPPDETLLAYREGRLEDAERRRLETLFAHSAEARSRLIELSGAALATPSPALRNRVLPQSPLEPQPQPQRRQRWWAARAAAAAICLVALGGYLSLSRQPPSRQLQQVPPFDVSVEALTEVRSALPREPPDASQGARHSAYAETQVRIVMEPTADGAAGVDFGLYLQRAEVLVRLLPGSGLQFETHRGAAVFEAAAARLVGASPGVYELFAVAAPDLPATVELTPGDGPQTTLEVITGGRVYRQEIVLLAHPPQ